MCAFLDNFFVCMHKHMKPSPISGENFYKIVLQQHYMLVSCGQTTFSPHGTYCWIISASFWSRRLYPTISAMWRKRVWPHETNTVLYIRFILTCNLSPTVLSQQTDHITLQSISLSTESLYFNAHKAKFYRFACLIQSVCGSSWTNYHSFICMPSTSSLLDIQVPMPNTNGIYPETEIRAVLQC